MVRKDDLLAKVKENRAGHRAIVEEAIQGYRDQAIELLENHIAKIREGRREKVYTSLPEVEDHTKDYDRVIAMLEMTIDDEIELDESDFSSYVMDDWAWKRQFLTSNSTYSSQAYMATQSI